jgi:hypothetical protein
MAHQIGASFAVIDEQPNALDQVSLFRESAGNIIATCAEEDVATILSLCKEAGVGCQTIGETIAGRFESGDIGCSDPPMVVSLEDLRRAFTQTLESQLVAEVVTA